MGPPVVADDPTAVHREHHGEILHGDVVHDLIEASLQERRIHRDDRHDALGREPGREGHRVLLADTHVEKPIGKLLKKRQQTGAARHRGGDRNRALVGAQHFTNRVGEDRGVLRSGWLSGAGRRHAVPLHVVVLSWAVAVTLLSLHVNEDRAVAEIAGLLEDPLDREQVVTVDRAEICEAELLEEDVRDEQCLQAREDSAARLLRKLAPGHVLEDLTSDLFRAPIGLRGAERFEQPRDSAHVRRDAHPIVVQHDDHARAHVTDVVHGFERHARRQGSIADDRHHVVVVALDVARDRHSLGGGDGCPRVSRTELIVLGLASREEPRDPAELA